MKVWRVPCDLPTIPRMTITLKGTVAYDGTHFAGWQRQPGARTVQGCLEEALGKIANQPVAVHGAGRTDAGVHALGQVFSCEWPRRLEARLRHALCKMLGPELRVIALDEAAPGFNARFDAVAKRYLYTLDLNREPDPFSAPYAWHIPFPLDIALLRSLLPTLQGTHDFSGYQSAGSQMTSTVRTIHSVQLYEGGLVQTCAAANLYRFEFYGNAFLYKMVRNITGTLVEIGRGRFPATFLEKQLLSGGPFKGHCAPAHGLALFQVLYE